MAATGGRADPRRVTVPLGTDPDATRPAGPSHACWAAQVTNPDPDYVPNIAEPPRTQSPTTWDLMPSPFATGPPAATRAAGSSVSTATTVGHRACRE
jgi:hypothetical protein